MGTNYPFIVLKCLVLALCALTVISVSAKTVDMFLIAPMTSLDINREFSQKTVITLSGLTDVVNKEDKISTCIVTYIKRQSRSYTKQTQDNLYNLMNDFDNIIARLYNKQVAPSDITHNEKIEVLARIQCDAYYKIGVLK